MRLQELPGFKNFYPDKKMMEYFAAGIFAGAGVASLIYFLASRSENYNSGNNNRVNLIGHNKSSDSSRAFNDLLNLTQPDEQNHF